jgi:hypothetical protein
VKPPDAQKDAGGATKGAVLLLATATANADCIFSRWVLYRRASACIGGFIFVVP